MINKLFDRLNKDFYKFLCCNIFAALVNFLSRIFINSFTTYIVSVVIAYCFGMLTAFILNKLFVFQKSSYKTSRQFIGFVIVNLFAILQTVLFSLLFREVIFPAINYTFYSDAVAHLIGISIPVFTSYFGHKYFSFGNGKQI